MCPRCDGLLIEDWDGDVGSFQKCVNCGGVMPRFTSEESKQVWLARCAATRAAKKGGTSKPSVALVPRVQVPVRSKAVTNGNGQGSIPAAIEEIDSKIAALQNIREQLASAMELLNLT